jgi:hypothetical protein
MRFTARRSVGNDQRIVGKGWDDLSEAKKDVEAAYRELYPGIAPLSWRDNGEYAATRVASGDNVWAVYDLYCDGYYTGYTIGDSVSYNDQARAVLKVWSEDS